MPGLLFAKQLLRASEVVHVDLALQNTGSLMMAADMLKSTSEQPVTYHYIIAVVKQVHLLPVKNHHDAACGGDVRAVLCFWTQIAESSAYSQKSRQAWPHLSVCLADAELEAVLDP